MGTKTYWTLVSVGALSIGVSFYHLIKNLNRNKKKLEHLDGNLIFDVGSLSYATKLIKKVYLDDAEQYKK